MLRGDSWNHTDRRSSHPVFVSNFRYADAGTIASLEALLHILKRRTWAKTTLNFFCVYAWLAFVGLASPIFIPKKNANFKLHETQN